MRLLVCWSLEVNPIIAGQGTLLCLSAMQDCAPKSPIYSNTLMICLCRLCNAYDAPIERSKMGQSAVRFFAESEDLLQVLAVSSGCIFA